MVIRLSFMVVLFSEKVLEEVSDLRGTSVISSSTLLFIEFELSESKAHVIRVSLDPTMTKEVVIQMQWAVTSMIRFSVDVPSELHKIKLEPTKRGSSDFTT